jgi:hypothetical protein
MFFQRIRNSKSVDAVNRDRKPDAQYTKKCGSFYHKKYVCTHGWEIRQRGSGKRPNQAYRSTSCEAILTVGLTKNEKVRVIKQINKHNHPVGEDLWYTYIENRRVKDPTIVAKVMEYVSKDVPFKKIHDYVRASTGKSKFFLRSS